MYRKRVRDENLGRGEGVFKGRIMSESRVSRDLW